MGNALIDLLMDQAIKGETDTYRVVGGPYGGAYAKVYTVVSQTTTREHILKLNPSSQPAEPTILARVAAALQKARVQQRVVAVRDYLLDPKFPDWKGHIEDLAPGKPVGELVPGEKDALQIAVDFAEVLRACARDQVAYLDVKPTKHIYWQKDPWQTTVIDWNVARLEAAPEDLRDDVLAFCRELPSIFRGVSQDSPENRLHPLGWSIDTLQDHLGRSLSFASWSVLARMSLSSGGPLLPVLADLVRVPNRSDLILGKGSQRTYDLVLKTWDEILSTLHQALDCWSSPMTSPEFPNLDIRDRMSRASIALLDKQPSADSAAWQSLRHEAEEQGKKSLQDVGILRATLQRDSQRHEAMLQSARLLLPQDGAAAQASSAYALWTHIGFLQTDGFWKQLVLDLAARKPREVRAALQGHEAEVLKELSERCAVENGDEKRHLSQVWRAFYREFASETLAWSYLEEARHETDAARQTELLQQVFQYVSQHPIAKRDLQDLKKSATRESRVNQLRLDLTAALVEGNASAARSAYNALTNESPFSTEAAQALQGQKTAVEGLEILQEVRSKLPTALGSWCEPDLHAILEKLLELPESAVRDAFAAQIRERLSLVHTLGKAVASAQSALAQAEQQPIPGQYTDLLGQAANEIGEIVRSYSDAPDLAALSNRWNILIQDHITRLTAEADKTIAKPRSAPMLDDLLDELDALTPILQAATFLEKVGHANSLDNTSVQWSQLAEAISRVKAAHDEAADLYAQLDQTWKSYTKSPSVVQEHLAEFDTLPASLRSKHRPLVAKALERHFLGEIHSTSDELALQQVTQSWSHLPADLQLDEKSLTLLTLELKKQQWVLESHRLEQHIPDSEWLELVDKFLKSDLTASIAADAHSPLAATASELQAKQTNLARGRVTAPTLNAIREGVEDAQETLDLQFSVVKGQLAEQAATGRGMETTLAALLAHTPKLEELSAATSTANNTLGQMQSELSAYAATQEESSRNLVGGLAETKVTLAGMSERLTQIEAALAKPQQPAEVENKVLGKQLTRITRLSVASLVTNAALLVAVALMALSLFGILPIPGSKLYPSTETPIMNTPSAEATSTRQTPEVPVVASPPILTSASPTATLLPVASTTPSPVPSILPSQPISGAIETPDAETTSASSMFLPVIGAKVKPVERNAKVNASPDAASSPLWTYLEAEDSSADVAPIPILEVVAVEDGNVVRVAAEFVILVADGLAPDEEQSIELKAETLLYAVSSSQTGAAESLIPAAVLNQDIVVSGQDIISGPDSALAQGSGYRVRLIGWITAEQLTPIQ